MSKPCPPSQQVGDYVVTELSFASITGTLQVLPADVDRVTIVWNNQQSAGTWAASTNPNAPVTAGFTVANTMLPYAMTYRDWGPLVGLAWYVIPGPPLANFTIWTVRYSPVPRC